MPIIKCKNHIEVYRHKAKSSDLNELSGRTGRADLTLFVNRQILLHLNLAATDAIVDIGCGDGTLLKLAAFGVRSAIGILPTAEEVTRISASLGDATSLSIRQGLADATGLPPASVDKIISNGVLILLDTKQIDGALQEMVRIALPTALVFIGEIPTIDERWGREYGDSIAGWLWHVLKNRGAASFFRSVRYTVKALLTSEPFVIAPKLHFYSEPRIFIERAARHGLILKTAFPHREKTGDGRVQDSKSRYDYVFNIAQ